MWIHWIAAHKHAALLIALSWGSATADARISQVRLARGWREANPIYKPFAGTPAFVPVIESSAIGSTIGLIRHPDSKMTNAFAAGMIAGHIGAVVAMEAQGPVAQPTTPLVSKVKTER